ERRAASWAFAVEMLRTSAEALHREQLLFGYHAKCHYAVMVPKGVLPEHIYLSGGSGMGKTSRHLQPLVLQLICGSSAPILVVDLKGDDAFFHAVREAALRSGRTFRFYTNRLGRSSHAFNPMTELRASGLPLTQSGETFRSALNLEYGAEYGASHFAAVTR